MANWIDYAVGGGIGVVGLFILYRALKEPMDLLFKTLGKGIKGILNLFSGGDNELEVIQYG